MFAAGCAGPLASRDLSRELAVYDLQARLAARAASLLGRSDGFQVGTQRFNADCTGFVEAVYETEGVPLRALMLEAAPDEPSGVAAAYLAMQAHGHLSDGADWPAAGDLVFWHDTYDRNRNGKTDDRLTHVGIVEYVVDGTVVFLHRGGKAVARGAMNLARPAEQSAGGVVINSTIRRKDPRLAGVPALAGALFAAYGRFDPASLPGRIGAADR